MIHLTHFFTLLFLCFAALLMPASAQKLDVSLSSSYLLPGEKAILEYTLSNARPLEELPISPVPNISLQTYGFGPSTVMLPGRNIGYSYKYIVSASKEGTYTIPAISLRFPNKEITTSEITFQVIAPIELTTQQVVLGNRAIRYAAFFRAAKTNPYEGEIVPVELKIYFPADIDIEEWGIPDFERDGLTAWRFEPRPLPGAAMLLGQECQVASYPSNLSAIKAGNVTIGPAKIRLITQLNSFGPFGSQTDLVPLNITASPLVINAQALPPNAPSSFSNAVGNFTMDIGVAETEVREGDPVNVEMEISGSGNLDSLDPPVLSDTEGWKIYDPTRSELGEERRYHRGMIRFTQFMRPTQRQAVIPPFDFTFFNPEKKAYETLRSSPIPLTLLPSTAGNSFLNPSAPPAADIPVERMTDILGLITNAPILQPIRPAYFEHLWHILPIAVLLVLLIAIYIRRIHPRSIVPAHTKQQRLEWKDLSSQPAEAFLREAGRFIEKWHPLTNDPDLQAILKERDLQCFRPASSSTPLPTKQKNAILAQLKKVLPLITFLIAITIFGTLQAQEAPAPKTPDATASPAPATEAAGLYQKGQYKQAIDSWLAAGSYESLTPTTLFNIGNACYRMGSPGYAALYYRRALMQDPSFLEARQNLRFLERQFGSLTIKRPDYQYTLIQYPLPWIKNATWIALWTIVLSILVFPATARGSKFRIVAISALIIAPFTMIASFVAWSFYPSDSQFAAYKEQGVIVGDKVVARADAARTSAEVINAPAGSLCRIVRRTGKWTYVSFATETCGWVESSQIEPLIPQTPPKTPVIRPSESSPDTPSA